MKSKALCLILAMTLLISILSACGNTVQTTQPPETPDPSVTTSDAAPPPPTDIQISEPPAEMPTEPVVESKDYELPLCDEVTTLTAWISMNPTALNYVDGMGDNSVYKEAEKRTNVHVEFTTIPGNTARDKFPIMIAAGDYNDILGSMNLYTGGYDAAINEGIVHDLAELVPEYAPHYYQKLTANDAAYRTLITDGGSLPAFALIRENAFPQTGLIIRQDWLDILGLGTPETYNELYTALTKFKTELGVSSPLWLNPLGVGNTNSLAAGFDIGASYDAMLGQMPFIVKDGEVFFSYLEEGFKEYLSTMAKWYSEGLVWQDFATGGACMSIAQSAGYSLFLNGDIGVAYGEAGDIDTIPDAAIEGSGMVLMGLAEPVKKAGDTVHSVSASSSVGSLWCISTDCVEVELACRYFDYFFTDEGAFLANYGLENESYTMVNGKPAFTELMTNNPEGISFKAASVIYTLDDAPFACDMTRLYAIYSETTIESTRRWGSNLDETYYYPTAASLTQTEADLFSSKFGDLITYASEQIPAFIIGELDVDANFDGFCAKLKEMGIDECIALKQDAYDRYLSK